MSKLFWQLGKTTASVIAASILVANGNLAAQTTSPENNVLELIDQYGELEFPTEEDSMGQINNVFQLRDLSPDHWSFDAVRNLVEKYQCLSGFEDGTFRGELMLNRYQFAAALNKCLASIERLIQTSARSNQRGDEGVRLGNRELRQIKRLTEEFEAELAVLATRLDDVEGKVDFLEDHQFSTTTKLKGEVIFTLAGVSGDEQAVPSGGNANTAPRLNDNITFSDRVRLNFDTSFTGKDRLRTRLSAGNFVRLDQSITGTDSARLGHDQGGNNNIQLDELVYRFPVGDRTRIYVGANDFSINDIFDVVNPYLASSGSGGLSRFGRRNPIVHRGVEGVGVGVEHKFSDQIKLSALYLTTDDAANPSSGNGLFNGAYSAGIQLDYSPTEELDLAFTYFHSYQPGGDVNISGSAGSQFAREPFVSGAADPPADTSADRFGLAASWRVNERVNIEGWFGLASANLLPDFQGAPDNPNATVINWALHLAFPDLGREGNLGGIIFGMQPKVTDSDTAQSPNPRVDNDSSFHIEALYRYQVNDNIHVTPVFMLSLTKLTT